MNNKTLAKAIESEIHSYAKENLAIINIFIKEPSLKRFRKTEKMSRISYIASSGGLLGRVCERMCCEQFKIFVYICRYFPYRKVASSRLSWLVAHLHIFKLFMKGKFDAYVL